MARITVEDCLKHIPNRFQLALAAAYRARQLAQGHTPKIDTQATNRRCWHCVKSLQAKLASRCSQSPDLEARLRYISSEPT